LISILDAFRSDGVSFLTPYAPAGLDKETMIDVSHEALIRCWNSLAAAPDGWLHREFRDGLIWQSLLSQAEIFEKDPRKVLGPATTEDRERWFKDRTPAWSERYGGGWGRGGQLGTGRRSAGGPRRRRDRPMDPAAGAFTVGFVGAFGGRGGAWAGGRGGGRAGSGRAENERGQDEVLSGRAEKGSGRAEKGGGRAGGTSR